MKQIIILIIIALAAIGAVNAIPQIPVQVYGSITPSLPTTYPMLFRMGTVEFETTMSGTGNYGYHPFLALIPVDDPATPAKEGYVHGVDVVEVFINNVKVDDQTYPASVNRIDIALTQAQIDQITGVVAPPSGGGGYTPGTPPSGGGSPGGCFTRWNCTDWSACTAEGIQTRSCVDDGTCNKPDRTEERVCTFIPSGAEEEEVPIGEAILPEAEEEGAGWLIFIFIIVAAGGFGFVFYEWEKSRRKLGAEMGGSKLEDPSMQRLKAYVQQTLQEGYTKEQIKQSLLKEGWSSQIIRQVLR